MSETPTSPDAGREAIERRAWPEAKQWRISILASLVVLVALAGVFFGSRIFGSVSPQAAGAPPPGTFRATSQQLKTFTIEAVRSHAFVSEALTEGKIAVNLDRATPVVSPYSGRVTRVIAGLGDHVKRGAPLATLDAAEFVQAQNDLKVAAAQVKLARLNEARKHALLDAKGGSLQDWQQAQADLAAAEAAFNAVRDRLHIFGLSDEAVANLESSPGITPGAILTSPIDGVVVDRQLGPGQFVQAGGSAVFTVADPSSVWLLANVREADAGVVKIGQWAEVHVLAYPKRAFRAKITYVAALVDPATHRLPVRAEIDNRDLALKPEMFASFRIETSGASDALALPEEAVVYEGDTTHVWVVSGDGLIAYRSVRVGRVNDGLIEIIEGLKAGEKVVIRGGLFIDQAAAPGAS